MVPVDEPEEDDEEDEVYEFVEEETEQKSNPIPPTEDEVREHNLGTAENPQPNRLAKTNKTNTLGLAGFHAVRSYQNMAIDGC